jgi:hypothetical protein
MVLCAVVASAVVIAAGRLDAAAEGTARGAELDRGPAGPTPVSRRRVMLELFTSQGCSSCPAADAFVRELPALGFGRDRVVPLAFHVDYWDDLGWPDPFASRAFSERQRDYVRSGALANPAGESGVSGAYTPQMIIDGHVHFSGGRKDRAVAEIRRAEAERPVLDLTARAELAGPAHDGHTVLVHVGWSFVPGATSGEAGSAPSPSTTPASGPPTTARLPSSWRLWVAVTQRAARTPVTRGENGGETLEEAAVVRALSAPVALTGIAGGPLDLRIAAPPGLAAAQMEIVAFVQDLTSRRVVAVTATGLGPSPS